MINTRIKERPVNKKRLFRRYLLTVISALIFGFVACFTFIAIEAPLTGLLRPDEAPSIVEFADETVETELQPEDMLTVPEEGRGNVTVEEVQEIVSQEIDSKTSHENAITREDLNQLAATLAGVAKEAARSMVTVSVVREATDWFDNSYEASGTAPGIVVADNGIERLILTGVTDPDLAEDLRITFFDGTKVRARIKAMDSRTGLSVLSASHSLMSSVAKEQAVPVSLGSSAPARLSGMPIIALLGQGAVSYGTASLATRLISLPDINLKLIQTDIYTPEEAAGFLFDLSGQLVGVIPPSLTSVELPAGLNALGITELRILIESLSNGNPMPYLGVLGLDITEDIAQKQNIPRGAYITETEMNSPAMRMGLRPGDIVCAYDRAEILSFRRLTEKLLDSRTGTVHRLTVLRESQGEYRQEEVSVELSNGQ